MRDHQPMTDLRRAQPEDAPAIAALVETAYAPYPARLGGRPRPMDADYGREIELHEVWVGPGEGPIAAVLVLHLAADHLWIENVAVAPPAQGRGLVRTLFAHANRRADELGLPELRLLTHELMTENRAIYEHLGWKPMPAPADGHPGLLHFRQPVQPPQRPEPA
jgi:N-acetylglutamate synthase-like GNAT family acetyltransferase